MNGVLDPETFKFDGDFLEVFTFFLNKYATDHASCSALELVADLQQRFLCIAVALIRYRPQAKPFVTLCYPYKNRTEINWALEQDKTDERIRELLGGEQYDGNSLCLYTVPQGKDDAGIREVDLILVPHLADSEVHLGYAYLFMLLDPARLKPLANHRAERDSQRTKIAQFLLGWWVRVAAPKFRLDRRASHVAQNDGFPAPSADRLYIATLSELIQEGNRSAEFVRRHGGNARIYFEGEIDGIAHRAFDWTKWTPRLPFSKSGQERLKAIRAKGELLVYWCRWVKSHIDLEREQTASISLSSAEKDDRISVSKWCGKQRQRNDIIRKRLEDLRAVAANEFLTGRAELATRPPDKENLPIGPKALLCFCMNRWLAPGGRLCANLTSNIYSDIEFCRTLHGVAVTAHYLLGEQSLTDDNIHRLIQLMAQYGHGDLGIPARLDLRAHLLQAARGEPALHALKRFYRDHFFHAMEVCFLGHVLLETELYEDRCLWQVVAERLNLPGNKQKVLRLWYMAALLHDIGYAMDVLNSSRKFLDFFHHSSALKLLDKSFEDAISQLSKEPELKAFGIQQSPGTERDHGIIGALHLQSLLKRIHKEDSTIDVDEYKPAIEAIALHNLRGSNDRVSFSKQPLAFLLAVCDQLQEWRRPHLSFATSPNWMLAKLGGAPADSAALEGAFKSMNANLSILTGNKGDIKVRFRAGAGGSPVLAFTLEYDEEINRNSGVFSVWLDATLNFQRLDFDGLPLDISVTYITPFYENHEHGVPQSQLNRLRNAAHETHMSFLMEWFPTRQEKTAGKVLLSNEAITYCSNSREELTLNLRALSKRILMTRGMDAFRKCLQEWKHFNDDRDFPGDYVSVTPE